MKAGRAVSDYNDVNWSNFIVENAVLNSARDHLVPFSAPNFARLPAGKNGSMTTKGGLLLYDFHYGCTSPAASTGRKGIMPIACTVSLTGFCSYDRASATKQTWKFDFKPTCQRETKLAGYDKSKGYVGPGYGACSNFIWSASGPNGRLVDLYVDEVIFKRVPYF